MAAVVMGSMLASAVIKETTRKLGSAIGGEIKLHWNFKRDMEELKETLESIEAVLEDAERRSIKEKTVQLWLKRLKSASYDITDMLEEFEAKSSRVATRKPSVKIFRLTKITNISLAHKMKKLKGKLKNITDQYQSFGFKQGSSSNEQQVPDKRETSSKEDEEFIVGRTEEKQTFISFCLSDNINRKLIILPIYGIGGIGKTTFAKMVFNDTQFKDYSQVWIYVSRTFDINKIGNSIISELSKVESKLTTRQMIHNSLGKPYADKKIMIVLDDLWETDEFELVKLKTMLNVGNARKVIVIVTTRDKEIAYKICTIEPYKLPPLTVDMCWTIIKQKVIDFEARPNNDQLELVGREIALKCGGVALAAQALGYMLRSMAFDTWVSVRDSDIWNISISGDKSNQHHNVISSLMLSYNTLPPCLKLCFAYCATFSKGQKIVKDDLIYQWISLGFVEPPSIFTTWQHGENYVSHLVGMCFLQYSKSPSTAGVYCEDATLLTMHDLVHDLARYVMVDEILDASKQGDTRGSRCRFALLNDCTESLRLFTHSPSKIRALRYVESDNNLLRASSSSSAKYLQLLACGRTGLHDDIFSSPKYLRVLDLSECIIQNLPDSISQLKQLRYLRAPGIQDRKITSSITKLSKLMYLNIRGSSISVLPESIGEMEGLNHLDLSGCSKIKALPESFGNLKKLVYLDLSNCSSLTCVSESLGNLTQLRYLNLSCCTEIGELPLALGNLTELDYLNLSCSSFLIGRSEIDTLGTLTKLEYLNLSSEYSNIERLPESLGSFIQLKYLSLAGCKTLKELRPSFGKLRNLVHLDLSGCFQANGVPEALCSLTKLQYLNLSHCFIYPEAQQYLGGLPKMICTLLELRYLNLSGCLSPSKFRNETTREIKEQVIENISSLSNLEHLVLSEFIQFSVPDSFSNLRKLRTLDLSGCSVLRRLPESMSDMDNLKFLILDRCWSLDMSNVRFNKSSISLPMFVVQAGEGEQSSNLVLLEDVCPPELEIICLDKVKSVEEAQRIKLLEKHSLEKLTLKWTREERGFLEDRELLTELVPPSSLTEFMLQGYKGISFPNWTMDMASYLSNLVTLKLVGLPQCINLPPLGQLRNLKLLALDTMPTITKIDRSFCGGAKAFPRLEEFYLFDMEGLEEWTTTYSSCDDVAYDQFMFPNLQYLDISCCRKLRLKPCPPRVEVAWRITDSDGVLTQLFGESVSDNSSVTSSSPFLKVSSCEAPMHSWRLLHHLPALRKLMIEDCNDLSMSPEILQTLRSLKSITVEGNDSVEMPGWLAELTSLNKMVIQKCTSVLEPLQEVGCTSLQSLKLHGCERMASLPQWLRVLTSIRKLEITGCRNLSDLETMQHLLCLESLELYNCGSIQALPEELGGLTCLKELSIVHCEGLTCLPESVQQLTNLETLNIRWCPALAQWCNSEDRPTIAHVKYKKIFMYSSRPTEVRLLQKRRTEQ